MGKHRGKKGAQRGGAREPMNRDSNRGDWKSLTPAEKTNAAFEAYYKAQGIMSEDEWPQFIESLRVELPVTFRVTGSRAHAETINDIIKESYVPNMQNVEFEGKKYDPPSQLPWYPGQLAWQIEAPKRVVRKTEPFKAFQRFLVGETEVGNLSRQEAVSMIPPLFLDVEPHHYCLDMCAAPGSKTAQIIEALNPHHTTSTGLLIANDSDYKRTHMLVHQTGRMPSRGLIVTNFDASMFPAIKLSGGKNLQFDRILADVPCSGDGTLRKNIEIWSKWGAADGNSLHSLQLRILERAMAMLKPGGRLVYSTCSFNPSEDESVIAAALNNRPGKFSIVDVSAEMPELKRRAGMSSWKVGTQPESRKRELTWYESYEEYRKAVESGVEKENDRGRGLPSTLWPPANAKELNLERCMRLLPHDQNTGGFFVCVLQKAGPAVSNDAAPAEASASSSSLKRSATSPAPEAETKRARDKSPEADLETAAPSAEVTEGEATPSAATPAPAAKPEKKEKRDLSFREDPLSYVDPYHEEVKSLIERFKFKDTFPKDNLMVRNDYGDPLRTMYLTNDIVKDIIQHNDYTRLRIVSAGVKCFARQDSQQRTEIRCKWRTPVDGILEVLPHVGDGIVISANLAELRTLLEDHYPALDRFQDTEFKRALESRDMGCEVVKFEAGKSDGGELRLPMWLPVWKAKMSLSLMIDKREKSILSLRTFGEDICKPPPSQAKPKLTGGAATEAEGQGEGEVAEVPETEGEGLAGVALVGEAVENAVKSVEALDEEDAMNA
ncbi:multisite-specific tRNA:(cytosine-C5)-methyltransferase [Kwoniella heveanensis CBS 569]|uniref:Multisite-specific tRNA:(Cytosine-C5)-methyltransferase n=1 Tax=Kwoniella heveanensis BCC8398 TaxID=1296120 RepID=A0A1B9H2G8_9TREE|nr:multisite-specific tRNA:(cytosine-C5)-methyltransferase [Kwoniella heveanensis BCC8398]OCF42361.1 multisite-specific tRNA:(cytosine-C5)-methyltransferase [Kwoniella heveanensis CBS 569]